MTEISNNTYYSDLPRYLMVPHMDSKNDDYKWLPVTAVVTYDGSLLLYEYFESDAAISTGDNNDDNAIHKGRLKWYSSTSLLRINLRQSKVEPLLTLGLDTFVVKSGMTNCGQQGATSMPASPLGNKDIPPIALLADETEAARKWIHACSHPSSDADVEVPSLFSENV